MIEKRRRRAMYAFGPVLLAALMLSGLAAGSASATTQHWYSCQEVSPGTGGFTNAACSTQGKGNYEWGKVGTSSGFSLEGGEHITLSATISGLDLVVECYKAKASGTVGNPAEGGAGTLTSEGASSLVLSKCFDEAGGCKVKGGKITFNSLKGEATESEGKPALKLQNTLGGALAPITIEGCTGSYTVHNGLRKLTGSLYGISNGSTLEFTKTSSSPSLGGAAATFVGSAALHTSSGGALKVGISAPVNTALPTITPSSPKVGSEVSASTGSWINAPTQYTYSWKRCDEGGECSNVFGGTKSTYTPTADDAGYKLVVKVTATNEGGSTQASSSPTGLVTATPAAWYACQKENGEPQFTDSACTKMGVEGEYAWTKLTSPTGFTMSGLTGFALTLPIGTSMTISCSSLSAGGSVENHAGSAGTASVSEPKFTLGGCSVTSPTGSGCEVSSSLQMVSLTGEITEVGGQTAVKFSAKEGGSLIVFGVYGCKSTALNGEKTINGSLSGIWNGAARALEFTSSSSSITLGGISGTFVGNAKIETSTGQPLKPVL